MIKYQESGWPNSLLTLKLRFYTDEVTNVNPKEFIPMWNGTVHFNPEYGENRPPMDFEVPANATKVEFVTYITGHGWGNNTCYNCFGDYSGYLHEIGPSTILQPPAHNLCR